MASKYDKRRLTELFISDYIKDKDGEFQSLKLKERRLIADFEPLLQRDYGEDCDCTLTSMTAIIHNNDTNLTPQEIYDVVEKTAKKYFYNGAKWGTFPLFIKSIFDNVYKKLGKNTKTYSRYVKGIGYSYDTIKFLINEEVPIILSLKNDGRNYYTDHSITIIGYSMYVIDGREEKFLLVYDNWYKSISVVDYKRLSSISCINY